MIRKLILGVLLNTLALYAVTQVMPEVVVEGGWAFLIVAGSLLGFLNTVVKPVAKIFSFPLIFLTGGLFLVVINAALIWCVDMLFDILAIDGFGLTIEGLWIYLGAGAVFGLVNWLEHWLLKK